MFRYVWKALLKKKKNYFPIATTATVLRPCLLGGVPLRGAGGGGGLGGASSRGTPAPPGGLATATSTNSL